MPLLGLSEYFSVCLQHPAQPVCFPSVYHNWPLLKRPAGRREECITATSSGRLRRLGLRPGDGLLAGGILLLAGLLLAGLYGWARPGGVAVVTFPDGEERISLNREGETVVSGKSGPVRLRVEDGRIAFIESGCPDRVCVHAGWLSREGQSAACIPQGVLVRIESGTDDLPPVDVVAQ